MLLIVGLGNPGMRYKNTYHNLGFMVADALLKKLKLKAKKAECDAHTACGSRGGVDFVIAKPDTYMNASGVAVKKLMKHYGVDDSELIVIYDDADLPVGKLRLREEGSSGTHNGMRSVIAEIGAQNFKRLRVGIGREELKSGEVALIDYVLSKLRHEDIPVYEEVIGRAADAVIELIDGVDINRITEKLNRKA